MGQQRYFFDTLHEALSSEQYAAYLKHRTRLRHAASTRRHERQTGRKTMFMRTQMEIETARTAHKAFVNSGGIMNTGVHWNERTVQYTYACQSKFGRVRGSAQSHEEACQMVAKLSRARSDAKARLCRNSKEVQEAVQEARDVLAHPEGVPLEITWHEKVGSRKNVWVVNKEVRGIGRCTQYALNFTEACNMLKEMEDAEAYDTEFRDSEEESDSELHSEDEKAELKDLDVEVECMSDDGDGAGDEAVQDEVVVVPQDADRYKSSKEYHALRRIQETARDIVSSLQTRGA